MIQVVNKNSYKGKGIYIGRPSIYGNPYSHLEGTLAEHLVKTRDEAVSAYDAYMRKRYYSGESMFKRAIDRLVVRYKESGDLVLVCWCKPCACHGDVLAKFIEELAARRV